MRRQRRNKPFVTSAQYPTRSSPLAELVLVHSGTCADTGASTRSKLSPALAETHPRSTARTKSSCHLLLLFPAGWPQPGNNYLEYPCASAGHQQTLQAGNEHSTLQGLHKGEAAERYQTWL